MQGGRRDAHDLGDRRPGHLLPQEHPNLPLLAVELGSSQRALGRPSRRPWARAAASPFLVRLEIKSLSTSANRPNRAIEEYRLRGLRRRRSGARERAVLADRCGRVRGVARRRRCLTPSGPRRGPRPRRLRHPARPRARPAGSGLGRAERGWSGRAGGVILALWTGLRRRPAGRGRRGQPSGPGLGRAPRTRRVPRAGAGPARRPRPPLARRARGSDRPTPSSDSPTSTPPARIAGGP